jgi:hypothetical protein
MGREEVILDFVEDPKDHQLAPGQVLGQALPQDHVKLDMYVKNVILDRSLTDE